MAEVHLRRFVGCVIPKSTDIDIASATGAECPASAPAGSAGATAAAGSALALRCRQVSLCHMSSIWLNYASTRLPAASLPVARLVHIACKVLAVAVAAILRCAAQMPLQHEAPAILSDTAVVLHKAVTSRHE